MSFEQTILATWKFCLSFLKRDWNLRDYPIVIREMRTDLDLGQQHKCDRFLAQIVNWWVISGGGETREAAERNLEKNFEDVKQARRTEGRQMPRPGRKVSVEFASSARIDGDPELKNDFINRVLKLEWALVTDQSSLWDFHTDDNNKAFHDRIALLYGVDVSDIESGNLAEILERIAAARKS